MKKIFIIGILLATIPLIQAKGWVFQTTPNNKGAIVELEPYSHQPGQELVVLRGSTVVGRAKLLRFTKKDQRYALVQVLEGTISEGNIVEDADFFKEHKEVEKLNQNANKDILANTKALNDTDGSLASGKSSALSLLAGYSWELRNSALTKGFTFTGLLTHKFKNRLSLGAKASYSLINVASSAFSVPGLFPATNSSSIDIITLAARLGYFFTDAFYFGLVGGGSRFADAEQADMGPIIGAELGLELPLSKSFALTVNTSLEHLLSSDSNILVWGTQAGISLWF